MWRFFVCFFLVAAGVSVTCRPQQSHSDIIWFPVDDNENLFVSVYGERSRKIGNELRSRNERKTRSVDDEETRKPRSPHFFDGGNDEPSFFHDIHHRRNFGPNFIPGLGADFPGSHVPPQPDFRPNREIMSFENRREIGGAGNGDYTDELSDEVFNDYPSSNQVPSQRPVRQDFFEDGFINEPNRSNRNRNKNRKQKQNRKNGSNRRNRPNNTGENFFNNFDGPFGNNFNGGFGGSNSPFRPNNPNNFNEPNDNFNFNGFNNPSNNFNGPNNNNNFNEPNDNFNFNTPNSNNNFNGPNDNFNFNGFNYPNNFNEPNDNVNFNRPNSNNNFNGPNDNFNFNGPNNNNNNNNFNGPNDIFSNNGPNPTTRPTDNEQSNLPIWGITNRPSRPTGDKDQLVFAEENTFTTSTPRSSTASPFTSTTPLTDPTTMTPCERSCPVTPQFNPVCGSDATTYSNPGRLKCAQLCGKNVWLAHYGNCRGSRINTPPFFQDPQVF